jgi:hypothetical protein
MQSTTITDAIREALDQCYASSAPLVTLGAFIDRLSADPDWSPAEVQEVRATVIQILGNLAYD